MGKQKGVSDMAARTVSRASRRMSSVQNQRGRQAYIYGNVVPKQDYRQQGYYAERPEKKVSRQVRQNRDKALHMSSGYVMFLAAAAVLALVICVNYIQLQSRLTSTSKNITHMQQELVRLREENNTKYNAVMDSINLEDIRERAEEMGMVYADADQVVEYKSPSTDYVKQYENIPEDGVLAQSDKSK